MHVSSNPPSKTADPSFVQGGRKNTGLRFHLPERKEKKKDVNMLATTEIAFRM